CSLSYVTVALSVSTSTRGSPGLTAAPVATNHCVIVPSSIESDRRGMTISMATDPPQGTDCKRLRYHTSPQVPCAGGGFGERSGKRCDPSGRRRDGEAPGGGAGRWHRPAG